MHSFIPSLLLAALASSAAGLPGFNGPFNVRADSTKSILFPSGTGFPHHTGAFGTGTGSAHGTGAHGKHHPHHPHHTGTGASHHSASASATLAARQFPGTGAPSFTFSFPHPTGTGGFPHGSGFFGHPTGHGGHHSHSGSGFVSPTDGIHNAKHFPSFSMPTGTGGFASPSGTGIPGHHPPGPHAKPSAAANILPRNFARKFPSGVADPSGGFPSFSMPHGTGFGGGAPTGGFGGPCPTGGFGDHEHVKRFGKGFPAGTGCFEPTGGFPKPTGTGGAFHHHTTFQTSAVATPSAA